MLHVANALEELNLSYVRLYSEQPSLDDVFLAYTGKDFEIHEDILKIIYLFIKRRFKRFFILVLGVTLSNYLGFTLFRVFFSGIMNQDMGTVRVAMTTNNPYHYVFEQAETILKLLMLILRRLGRTRNR